MTTHLRTQRWLGIAVVLTGLGAASWALAAAETGQPDDVLPMRPFEPADPVVRGAQERIYRLAQNQAHHLLPTVHPWADDPQLKLLTDSKSLEHWIRPNTESLQGLSFLHRFGPYDEKRVGVSRDTLLHDTMIPMMRYLLATHVTGSRPTSDGKPWGNRWQSAYWAQQLGRAAWWSWSDLPDDVRAGVRRVVAHEAERFVDQTPPHQLKRDTKSEENAWNSMIFDVAVLLMPSDPRRAAWETAFQRWVMSSYLRPADESSRKIVDGRPVSEQFTGANIYDDFTLENHGKVHPDYMGAFTLTVSCTLDYVMTGRQPPEAILYNIPPIYENLKWFFLPDGGCVYPNGEDWELFTNIPSWSDQHIEMAVFAQDPDGWSLLQACLATTEKMQARHADGAIHDRQEYFYPGTQQGVLQELAREWLMLQSARTIVDRPRPLVGVKRLDSGKIILNRTPRALHTLTWGAVVMAQCVPMRMDRIVSPDTRDGIGSVRLPGEKRALPVELQSAHVSEQDGGFVGQLIVHHGNALQAKLEYRSNADGTFIMREQLTALRDVTTAEIATGLIGILNDPVWVYETGQRRLQIGDQTAVVPALSGHTLDGENVRRVAVDGVLHIDSTAPLQVRYRGTKEVDRGRATDELYLNYVGGNRSWKTGQVISTFEVTITPSADTDSGSTAR